jgi:hypothetical protein
MYICFPNLQPLVSVSLIWDLWLWDIEKLHFSGVAIVVVGKLYSRLGISLACSVCVCVCIESDVPK